jgi:hypothetical protein
MALVLRGGGMHAFTPEPFDFFHDAHDAPARRQIALRSRSSSPPKGRHAFPPCKASAIRFRCTGFGSWARGTSKDA